MIATWVTPKLTTASPAEASRGYRVAMQNLLGREPTPAAVAVLHAQGALETGNFKSCWNGNAGNVKAGDKWTGLYTTIKLNEVINGITVWFDPRGQLTSKNGDIVPGTEREDPPGHPQCRIRAYETLDTGIFDKIRFLTGTRWRSALNLALAGDAAGYVAAVRAAGYFTAPLEPYLRAVVSLAAKLLPVATGIATEPPVPIESDDGLCRDMAACLRFELPDWLAAKIRILQSEHIEDALERARSDRDRDIKDADE